MLKLFRVEHLNAEELMKNVLISHYDLKRIECSHYDRYRKSQFVILVYAQSIEEIKKQYKYWDHGGFDSNIYHDAFKNGIIKEVEKISDLDDVNYYDIKGKSVYDDWLPDVCMSKAYKEYFKDSDEEEYVMDFLRKKENE
jgi:hypothetical protein